MWLSEQATADGVGGCAGERLGGVLVGGQHGAGAPAELVLNHAFLDPGLEVERRRGVPGVMKAGAGDARAVQDGFPVVVVALGVDASTCWCGEDSACRISGWGTGPQ